MEVHVSTALQKKKRLEISTEHGSSKQQSAYLLITSSFQRRTGSTYMSKLCSATGADAKELVLSEYCITCALRNQQKVFSYPIQTALKTPKPS